MILPIRFVSLKWFRTYLKTRLYKNDMINASDNAHLHYALFKARRKVLGYLTPCVTFLPPRTPPGLDHNVRNIFITDNKFSNNFFQPGMYVNITTVKYVGIYVSNMNQASLHNFGMLLIMCTLNTFIIRLTLPFNCGHFY